MRDIQNERYEVMYVGSMMLQERLTGKSRVRACACDFYAVMQMMVNTPGEDVGARHHTAAIPQGPLCSR